MRMESDEFDFLAPAYVRGFLKSYARYLGVGDEALLAEFDQRYGTARLDASQLRALESSTKDQGPKQRAKLNSWGVAAAIAAGALVLLMIIGVVAGPQERASEPVANRSPTPDAGVAATPSPTPTKSAPPASPQELALSEGIDLEIVASRERCWIQVYSDGSATPEYSGVLEVGQSRSFSAQNLMTLVLGNAKGVDLVVNGHDIGSPGGIVRTVRLPQDIKTLL